MADDGVTFQSGQPATPPEGTVVAIDNIAGKDHQYVKVEFGASGTATPVSAVNPLPVSAASLPLPALAATSSKQSDGTQKTQVVDGSGNVIGATSNALDVNIKSGNPTTIAATQSGTWTVQPGNTANTTAWKVDGSAVTQPVSIASVPSHAVTNAGTFAVQATEADGANTTLGAKADAKSAASDTTAISAMSVWKQISFSIQAAAASLAGTLTVASHAVTNAGTFAVQAALTAGSAAVGTFRFTPAATSALTEVKIDTASSGDLALVSATSSVSTKLYQIFLVAAGATTLTFKDGSTTLTGAVTLNAGGSFVLDFNGEPWFTGTANTTFNLNNSAAVQISGRAYYIKS